VVRSTVVEDQNEGVCLISLTAEFSGGRGGRFAVLLTPLGLPELPEPLIRPLREWEGLLS
jgi:hypothetical protein